jgi:hypothetical protein
MLVLDAFKGHLTDSVKNQLCKMKTELFVIPGGMTSVLQPMDVSINKHFKDRLRQQYLTWIADPACELTETGKIKHVAPSQVTQWVSAAWKAIPESIIIRSFNKCCISKLWMDPKMTLYGRTMLKIKMMMTGWRAWITIQL